MSVATANMFREIVGEILDTPLGKLNHGQMRERLGTLRAALPELGQFVDDAYRMVDRLSTGAAPVANRTKPGATTTRNASGTSRRGRPSRDGLRPTSFILETVRAAAKQGISPSELIAKVEAMAPDRRGRAGNVVSPLLNRLKKRGEVINRGGRWFIR